MAKPFITIIGLGNTGTTVGLALQRTPGDFDIVGHDKGSDAEQNARRLNAVTRTEWNLHRACEGASLVVLALPLTEIGETLRLIGEDLAPNTLVLVLSSLFAPAERAAAEALPRHDRVVVGYPVTLGGSAAPGTPGADALVGRTFALAAGPQTNPAALELASDFVERVGAKPHFMDPVEHDGILAGVEQLPQVLGALLMSVSAAAPGWREAQRLAGRRFAAATDVGGNAEQLFAALMDNRENVARRLADFQRELARWRALLDAQAGADAASAAGDGPHPLLAALQGAVDARASWEAAAQSDDWEKQPGASNPVESGGSMFRQLFVGNLGRKPSKPDPRSTGSKPGQ
jgi:prephenate dehydrogenase